MLARKESRKSKRRPKPYAAWIKLSDYSTLVRCVLWNISDGGTCLTARINDLPDRFSVVLNGGEERSCRLIWRNGGSVGVAFINDPGRSNADDLTRRDNRSRTREVGGDGSPHSRIELGATLIDNATRCGAPPAASAGRDR